MRRELRDWESETDLQGEKKGVGFETEREVGRKVREVRGGNLKGKAIEMSQGGRGWAGCH